jgi:hypothetical protein
METTATSISASGKTGGLCSVSGPYKSSGTGAIVFFKQGEKFTADANGKATLWTLLK